MQVLGSVAGVLLLSVSMAASAASEDEIWIERYMSEPGHSAQPAGIRPGYRVEWKDLGRFIGVPVKVSTESGASHRGQIVRADSGEIRLRAESHGGYAELTLRRDQVINAELE